MSSNSLQVTHVLFLAESPGQNPVSGAENQIFSLLESLARSGIDVELIAMIWSSGPFPIVQGCLESLRSAGVQITLHQRAQSALWHRWFSILRGFLVLGGDLRRRRKRIIHLHLDLRFAVATAWLAGCRRLIVSIHNDEAHYRRPLWRWWLGVSRGLVWHFVGITEHVTQYIREVAGLSVRQASTITYGIDVPKPGSEALPTVRASEGRFTVGFVGRLTEQKNLPALLEAAKALPAVDFILVGDGPDRAALEALCRRNSLHNVFFRGAIANASRIMHSFDLLILPSLWEGLGLVLLEAMIQGVPVAGSSRGAIPYVLDQGRCGLIFDPDPTSIAAAIKQSIDYPVALAERALLAKEFAASEFSRAAANRRTIALYRDCSAAFTNSKPLTDQGS